MDIKNQRDEYLQRLAFEHELISRRVSWLLTSQTILYAAYGVIAEMNGDNNSLDHFFNVVAYSGLAISFVVLVGITAAARVKYLTWQKYIGESGDKNEPFGGINTCTTYIGFVPDFVIPMVFIFGWLAIITCQ